MAEPVSIPLALAAGASAAVVALLGVEPQALAWALVGSIFGAPLAPPAGRFRQLLVGFAVMLASALLGTVFADWMGTTSPRWRNASCLVFGAIFHPLFAAVIATVPNIVATVLQTIATRRAGGSLPQPPQQPPPGGQTDGPR